MAYANRLGGNRREDLQRLLDGPLKGIFGGMHILPFFYPNVSCPPEKALRLRRS